MKIRRIYAEIFDRVLSSAFRIASLSFGHFQDWMKLLRATSFQIHSLHCNCTYTWCIGEVGSLGIQYPIKTQQSVSWGAFHKLGRFEMTLW